MRFDRRRKAGRRRTKCTSGPQSARRQVGCQASTRDRSSRNAECWTRGVPTIVRVQLAGLPRTVGSWVDNDTYLTHRPIFMPHLAYRIPQCPFDAHIRSGPIWNTSYEVWLGGAFGMGRIHASSTAASPDSDCSYSRFHSSADARRSAFSFRRCSAVAFSSSMVAGIERCVVTLSSILWVEH